MERQGITKQPSHSLDRRVFFAAAILDELDSEEEDADSGDLALWP